MSTRTADLESRVRQSNEIYDKTLEDRKGLIQKFGPTPSDIALYVAEFHNCFDNVS
jgi:regulator of sigma D